MISLICRPSTPAALVVFGVVFGVGCTDLTIPEGAQVSCSADDQCPLGFVCRADAARCIDAAVLGKSPIRLSAPATLTPLRLSHADGFSTATLNASFSEAPVETPLVTLLGQPLSCTGSQELVCTFDAATDALPEGTHELRISARDAAANVAEQTLAVVVDLTAPAVADAPPALLEAAADNPILRPIAMTHGTTARVNVALNELLGEEPVALVAGTAVSLLRVDNDALLDSSFTFAWTFGQSDIVDDGPRDLALHLVDEVGNAADVEVDVGIVVDTVPPAAAPVEISGAVLYRRAPWGLADDPTPRFSVRGRADPDVVIEALADEGENALLLGRGVADADGGFDLPLVPVDLARVFLVAWDQAGNPSAAVRVHDIEWTAGLGRKERGSRLANPHAVYVAETFLPTALQGNLAVEADPAPLLSAATSLLIKGGASWVQRRTVPSNAQNIGDMAVAYHRGLGKIMVFGGFENSLFAPRDQTFVIEGDTFEALDLAEAPPPGAARMAYDGRRDRLVLVSQADASTWVFDEGRWRAVTLAAAGPRRAELAYDPVHDTVVALEVRNQQTQATWLFRDESWTQLDIAAPTASGAAALAWDDLEQRVILYGGDDGQSALFGEVWAFDGASWTQVGNGPPVTRHAAFTGPDGAAWFAGGQNNCPVDLFDCDESQVVSAWRGQSAGLVVVTTAPASTPAALGGLMGAAFDLEGSRLVAFGGGRERGIAGLVFDDELHVFDGTDWRRVESAAPSSIGNRTGSPPLLFDPARNGLLAAGGTLVGGAVAVRTDTQLFGDDNVRQLAADAEVFGFQVFSRSTPLFLSTLGPTLIAGGQTGRLARAGWVLASVLTPTRTGMAAVLHEQQNATLLFGGREGSTFSDVTLRFDGSGYGALRTTTAPPPRELATMVWDPARNAVVLFGGVKNTTTFTDTWSFVDDWALITADGPIVAEPTLVYDNERELLLLVGNQGNTVVVHEFVDGVWRERAVDGLPDRRSASVGYDPHLRRLTLHGGTGPSGSVDETFSWNGSTNVRPAAVFQIDLRARGAAEGAVIERVDIQTRTGAHGFDSATAAGGSNVLLWSGAWLDVGSHDADVLTPSLLEASVVDTDLLARLDPDLLHVAVASRLANGKRQAEVVIDAMAVSLSYREP